MKFSKSWIPNPNNEVNMKPVAYFFSSIAAVIMITTALPASAKQTCRKGDHEEGPNCINVIWVKPNREPRSISTAYRINNKGLGIIVWKGPGEIIKSTSEYLKVVLWIAGGRRLVVETHRWNKKTSKYVYASTEDG